MRPSGSSHDIPDIRVCYAESLGYLSLRNTFCRKAANLPNISLSDLGVAVGFAPSFSKNMSHVKAVFRLGAVFEILKSVICFYAVLVVYLKAVRSWADERLHDKRLDGVASTVFAKLYLAVAAEVETGLKNSASNVSSAFLDVPDATLVGYLVSSFIPNNRFPRFHINHL